MQDKAARGGVSIRVLRAGVRLLLCLALILVPVAAVNGAHFAGEAAAAAVGHDHDHDPASPDTHAPFCHQAGACHAFVAPAAPALAHSRTADLPEIPAQAVPASVALHRLFRPPIAAARA